MLFLVLGINTWTLDLEPVVWYQDPSDVWFRWINKIGGLKIHFYQQQQKKTKIIVNLYFYYDNYFIDYSDWQIATISELPPCTN